MEGCGEATEEPIEVAAGEKPLPVPQCAVCDMALGREDLVQVWLVCQNCGCRMVQLRCGKADCENNVNQTCKLRSIIIDKSGKCSHGT